MARFYAPLYNVADGEAMVIHSDDEGRTWEVYAELGGPANRPEAERIASALNNQHSPE